MQIKKDDSPCPTSYDADRSFKETQLVKPKFFISKAKILKFSELAVLSKKDVPAVGIYDEGKALDKISKLSTYKRQ